MIRNAKQSNIALLRKIGKSLERDRSQTVSHLAKKARIYLASMVLAPFFLRKCDSVGERPRTRRKPNIENSGKIILGNDININSRNVQTDLVTGPNGMIKIGNEVSINFGVSMVSYNKISIGNRVRVGPYTMIYDSNLHTQGDRYSWAEGDPVIIEDDVWLASRVMVLKGSMIGRGSVVASGSVVSGIIPPYVVAGGIPARIIKFLKVPDNDTNFKWDLENKDKGYSNDTFNRVRRVFQNHFSDLNPEQFDSKLIPGSLKEWDSIAHVKFIRKLEQEFGITLRKKDWPRLSSIDKICRIIQKYSNQSVNKNLRELRRY